MIKNVKRVGVEESRIKINRWCFGDNIDEDIEVGAVVMSLRCPLSRQRMRYPCRTVHCTHLQCFDLKG